VHIILANCSIDMIESEEQALLLQLLADEANRDRGQYDYTADALRDSGITSFSIWPECNRDIFGVIKGVIDYDLLPVDELNEFHKGGLYTEQQDIVFRNEGKYALCEAQNMRPCLEENCILYNSKMTPPVCREFKIAFKK
jgi:hypothetical protein